VRDRVVGVRALLDQSAVRRGLCSKREHGHGLIGRSLSAVGKDPFEMNLAPGPRFTP
jgi:hypothetical protein